MKQILLAIAVVALVTGCAGGRGGNEYYGTSPDTGAGTPAFPASGTGIGTGSPSPSTGADVGAP